jgi:hypothetical protein
MSQAFVKEEDEQWLHEVAPTMTALVNYLTRQNNGIRVYEISSSIQEGTGIELHHMSNGMDYSKNSDGKWEMLL